LGRNSGARNQIIALCNNYLAQAKLDSALAEVDKAITRDPTFPCNSSYNARVLM
jgi:Tfp pilus assembly protein PilF